ncbi:hypothetical protein QJQ45_021899 [Haematococcus lacustris]|nr:hypothetical protein QJQ45_021899 [Haematococcus lacustris]
MAPASGTSVSFDDALCKYVGEFGLQQKKILVSVSVIWIPNALCILLMVFANKDPIKALWWRCMNEDAECLRVHGSEDPAAAGFCSLSEDSWAWTASNKSIISQFNLICSNAWLAQLVNSIFFLGYLIGSGTFGNMADRHGRKKTLMFASGLATLGTLMSALSYNYWVYAASRLLTGVGAAGQSLVTYLLATESVGPSRRGFAGVATQMVFIVGEFALVLVAFLLQRWQLIHPFIYFTRSHSLLQGRQAEAEAVMSKIAEVNGTRMPLEPLTNPPPAADGNQLSLGAVLKHRNICRRFTILAYVWCVLCMCYYGISLAVNSLQGSIYLIFLLAAAAEIPANLLGMWLIERIGRHNTLAAGILLAGLSCLVCSFCPPGPTQAIFAAIGKFGCAGAFTIASIFTSELFPTLVRSAVLGAENESARLGGIAAPFVVLLGTQLHNPSLPFVLFGVTSVLAGLLILTLPETLGAPLPDTMQDLDAISSIFSSGAYKQGWRAAGNALFHTRAHGSRQNLQRVSEEADDKPPSCAGPIQHVQEVLLTKSDGKPPTPVDAYSIVVMPQQPHADGERVALLGDQVRSSS